MTVSIKVYYRHLGGHVHVDVFTSEFGPETTHGKNGSLIFRVSEWPTFRDVLIAGNYGNVQLIEREDSEK